MRQLCSARLIAGIDTASKAPNPALVTQLPSFESLYSAIQPLLCPYGSALVLIWLCLSITVLVLHTGTALQGYPVWGQSLLRTHGKRPCNGSCSSSNRMRDPCKSQDSTNGGDEGSKPAQPGATGQPARPRRPDDSILADVTQHVAQLQSTKVRSPALLRELMRLYICALV